MKTGTKNRLAVAAAAVMCGLAALAMPTRDELIQAQKIVEDLTADDVRALKTGAKKAGEVAAAQLALADEAETEAGKYLLLQGAFKLYARSADYDAAAGALARMRKEIAGLPPEVVVELVNGEMRRVAAEKAPGVLAIFRDAQRTIKCRKELAAAEAAAQAKPSNAAVQRRLAECHAGLGDWAKALEIFAKAGDEAAQYELDPSSAKGYDLLKAANYWWDYPAKDDEPFKVHAAVLYKKGLDDGSISGLRKTLAEKRVKQMESLLPSEGEASARGDTPAASGGLYCVIDLSAGPNASKYPVSYLAAEPKGGWADEYKTRKLVLRRIDPGSFEFGADGGKVFERRLAVAPGGGEDRRLPSGPFAVPRAAEIRFFGADPFRRTIQRIQREVGVTEYSGQRGDQQRRADDDCRRRPTAARTRRQFGEDPAEFAAAIQQHRQHQQRQQRAEGERQPRENRQLQIGAYPRQPEEGEDRDARRRRQQHRQRERGGPAFGVFAPEGGVDVYPLIHRQPGDASAEPDHVETDLAEAQHHDPERQQRGVERQQRYPQRPPVAAVRPQEQPEKQRQRHRARDGGVAFEHLLVAEGVGASRDDPQLDAGGQGSGAAPQFREEFTHRVGVADADLRFGCDHRAAAVGAHEERQLRREVHSGRRVQFLKFAQQRLFPAEGLHPQSAGLSRYRKGELPEGVHGGVLRVTAVQHLRGEKTRRERGERREFGGGIVGAVTEGDLPEQRRSGEFFRRALEIGAVERDVAGADELQLHRVGQVRVMQYPEERPRLPRVGEEAAHIVGEVSEKHRGEYRQRSQRRQRRKYRRAVSSAGADQLFGTRLHRGGIRQISGGSCGSWRICAKRISRRSPAPSSIRMAAMERESSASSISTLL